MLYNNEEEFKIKDYLKTEPSDDVKGILINALDLPSEIKFALHNIIDILPEGDNPHIFRTVGDLLKYKYARTSEFLTRANKDFSNKNGVQIMQCIEEALAKLGVKFKDSDFTVYKMRVKSLDLQDKTKKLLLNLYPESSTVEYLCSLNYKNVESALGPSQFRNLTKYLMSLGVQFADTNQKIKQSELFPIHKYLDATAKILGLEEQAKLKMEANERKKILKAYVEILNSTQNNEDSNPLQK